MNSVLKFISALTFQLLDWIFPKDRNVHVVSGQRGARYFDNSRYLFEAMLLHCKNGRVYWMYRGPSVPVLPKGAVAVKISSLKGLYIALRAKTVFVSYGCADFGWLRFSRRKVFVQLWHGAPVKEIFLGQRNLSRAARLKNYVEISHYSYFIVSSQLEKELVQAQTRMQNDRIKILGYPRNDELKQPTKSTLEEVSSIRSNFSKVILFAPTFRESGVSPFSSISSNAWNGIHAALEHYNALLIIRAHATEFVFRADDTAINIAKNFSRIKFAGNDKYLDVQALMLASDILISDYSGIIIDYLLLERPIVQYVFDEDAYHHARGLSFLTKEFPFGFVARSDDELLDNLRLVLSGEKNPKSKELKNIFHEGDSRTASAKILEFLEIS